MIFSYGCILEIVHLGFSHTSVVAYVEPEICMFSNNVPRGFGQVLQIYVPEIIAETGQ